MVADNPNFPPPRRKLYTKGTEMNLTKEQALTQIENLKKFIKDLDKPEFPELIDGHWYQATTHAFAADTIYVYIVMPQQG